MNKLQIYQNFKKSYVDAYCAASDYLTMSFLYNQHPASYSNDSALEWSAYSRVMELVQRNTQLALDYLSAGGRRPLRHYLRPLEVTLNSVQRKHHQWVIRSMQADETT